MKKNTLKTTIAACTIAGMITLGGTASEAALGDRALYQGVRHNDVKELQQELKKKNFFTYGTTTTYFGNITKQAVMKFQRANGLSVDGSFGPASARVLKNASAGKTQAKPAPKPQASNKAGTLTYKRALTRGARGGDVKVLQLALKKLGHYKGSIDSSFGPGVQNGLMNFQRAQRISVDGSAGPATVKTINNVLTGKTQAKPAPKPQASNKAGTLTYKRALTRGARGGDVKALQLALKKLGHYKIGVDSSFGPGTRSALMSFQRAQRISVDGSAGPATVKTINNVLTGRVAAGKPSAAPSRNNSGKSTSINIVNTAKKYIGSRYTFGGSSPAGFDCSGFTQYVYKQMGVSIPRSTSTQANAGSRLSKSQLQPGDLLIFSNTYKAGPSHAGVYIGNGQFVHAANPSKGVRVDSINSNYYGGKFSYGRRVY